MAALTKIDELLRIIDCALVHPSLPSSSSHKRRSQAELRGPSEVTELYPIVFELYKGVEISQAFREPVNAFDFNVLDYYHRIKSPMSLRVVLDRLADPAAGFYSSRDQVLSEVDQIWRNCEKYNGPQNLITEAAHQCEAWLANKLQELEDSRLAENDAVDKFNDLFVEVTEMDPDAAEPLMGFVKSLNPKLLTSDGDLDLENLTAGELKAMTKFLNNHAAQKRARE